MKQPPILIIGKNGKTGSRVDRRLRAPRHGDRPSTALTQPMSPTSRTWPYPLQKKPSRRLCESPPKLD